MMDSPAELAAKKLAWEVESRSSVDLHVTTTIRNHQTGEEKNSAFNTIHEHYIETAAGQRFCAFRGLLDGKVTTRFEHFGDGKKFADVNFNPKNPDEQQAVIIKRQYFMEDRSDHKDVPQPLLYLYVGRTPLHEALPKAQYLGTEKVIGRDCDVFLFPKVRWAVVQDQVFSLDRETAIPLKVEAFRDLAARERHEPLSDWTAKSLDKIGGHNVPLKSATVTRAKDGTPSMSWDHAVDSITFGKDYPVSTFWPTIQPGVTVFDGLTAKTSTAPGKKAQPEDTASALSTQAVPPENWTANASKVSLGLGCAVLVVGLLLWWQRR